MIITTITIIALGFGLILGTILLLATVYMYIKHKFYSKGGTIFVIFGCFLIGLSVWKSIELSINSNGTFTAKYIQDLGASTADINGAIEKLKRQYDNLTQDMAVLKNAFPTAKATPEQISAKEKKEVAFERNSKYSVLVFYKPAQYEKAVQISKVLLSLGFRSSITATDLTEAGQQFDFNQAWVIYTQRGQGGLTIVKDSLEQLRNNIKYVYSEVPYTLRNGDIQILLC